MTDIDLGPLTAAKVDRVTGDNLIAGPRTITVTAVKMLSSEEQPVGISYEGDDGKPYKPCKSMLRVLARAWGLDPFQWVGKSMALFLDEKVRFGGAEVGGIRISHLSHIEKSITMALTATRATKKAYTVQAMAAPVATTAETPDESADLVRAGDAASSDGVKMYSAWLANLTPEQKDAIKQHHSRWSKAAKAADAQGAPGS